MPPDAVILILTIIAGVGHPSAEFRWPVTTVRECLSEAGRFLTHAIPEGIQAKRLSAECNSPTPHAVQS